MSGTQDQDSSATIGPGANTWKFSVDKGTRIFDLVREEHSRSATLQVDVSTGASIRVSCSHSALIVIDMQNYFLSSALGRTRGAGHVACDNLIQHAIPAARKAGIPIIWVNWGLEDADLETMPPAVTRCFGFPGSKKEGEEVVFDRHGTVRTDRAYGGLGAEMGTVKLTNSDRFEDEDPQMDAGRLLFRDTWNAQLYTPLRRVYEESASSDAWVHKNRMSGLWASQTPLQKHLEKNNITTLFFAGVNTDQCVGGTLTDAFSRGYDCVMLKDGCGTTSPSFAQEAWEFNVENTFGFVATCEDLWKAVHA